MTASAIKPLTAKWFFGLSLLLSVAVLIAWRFDFAIFDLVSPRFVSIKADTALGLAILSIAGLLIADSPVPLPRRIPSLILALTAGALGVANLLEHTLGWDIRLDQRLFGMNDSDLDLSPLTAGIFVLLAVAFFFDLTKNPRRRKFQQGLVVIGWVISFQALIGFIAGINTFGSPTQIALHTAVVFSLLSTGLLVTRPHLGFMANILNDGFSGRIGRRLLLFAIIIPPIINLVQVYSQRFGLWDDDFSILWRVMVNVAFFSWVAFQTSSRLCELERERSHAEEARHASMKSLEQAVRARDELLSVCSHEMRTPVTSMKLITQLTKKEIHKGDQKALEPERMEKVLDISERQLDRLSKLIEEMLDFSRINAGKLRLSVEDVDIAQLINEVTERFRPVFDAATCPVHLHLLKDLHAHWDRIRIEQVLSNLLSNSAKYGAGHPIDVTVDESGKNIRITVTNEGIGIAAKDQKRIFEPYERAVSVSNISGLGLGLYITRQIVEAHGGRIWVESRPGEGASFSVELPLDAQLHN